jgi:hypothetical protein
MGNDELEPGSRAGAIVHELREVADTIEANPELADLPDWYDAAQRMLMDLDSLDDE